MPKNSYYFREMRYHIHKNIALILYHLNITKEISPDNVLIGGEDIFSPEEWVESSGDYRRVSALLRDSHYVDLLKRGSEKKYITDAEIENTDYYRNALKCIDITGHYFGCKNGEDVLGHARNYLKQCQSIKENERLTQSKIRGASDVKLPVVFKIYDSDKYEIFDGHHRLAISCFLGRKAKVIVLGRKKTYLQKLVLAVKQTKQRRDLYQPFSAPEFNMSRWNVIRGCRDRFNMMKDFLADRNVLGRDTKIIDLACAYGWFVRAFSDMGFDAYGIDRDENALKVGWIVYGLNPSFTKQNTIEKFIRETNQLYDITLFLSVLHHYGLGIENITEKEILRYVDRITKKILFIDTGQNHEEWFSKRLSHWDDAYIMNLIKENTSFRDVFILGKDKDNKGVYKNNYHRTLFACIK